MIHHTRDPAGNGTCSRLGIEAAIGKLQRVEKGLNQAEIARSQIRFQSGDSITQLGVTKAVDRVGELGNNTSIKICRVGKHEWSNIWLDSTSKFLKNDMLILHLGGEFCRLEQAFTIPLQPSSESSQISITGQSGRESNIVSEGHTQPLVDTLQVTAAQNRELVGLKHTIMLAMKNTMDGREGDIFVTTTIAGHIVSIQ